MTISPLHLPHISPTSPPYLQDRYMHLTNYSVNKKSSDYERNTDAEKVLGVGVGGRSRGKGRGRLC